MYCSMCKMYIILEHNEPIVNNFIVLMYGLCFTMVNIMRAVCVPERALTLYLYLYSYPYFTH